MIRRIPFQTHQQVMAILPELTAYLRSGGAVAYPTETVYGFGGTLEPAALTSVAHLKSRDERKPFLLLVSNPSQCPQLEWNEHARLLAQEFWPGPLTLALRANPSEFPPQVISQAGTVAIRETPHQNLRTLLHALGEPITSTSANLRGQPPAASAEEAEQVLYQLDATDVWLLDGGVLPPSQPSTLVDCSVEPVRILRAGAVSVESLREVVEQVDG
jgi:L-threonylcarbamoyladenylate synthase